MAFQNRNRRKQRHKISRSKIRGFKAISLTSFAVLDPGYDPGKFYISNNESG